METTTKSVGSGIWRLNATLASVNEELMDNGGELTPELEERLANADMSQVEVVDGLHELIRMAKAEDSILAEEIKRLQGLKKARANAIDGLKRYLLDYMLYNGIQKIEGKFCKASVSIGKESVYANEDAMLRHYKTQVDRLNEELPSYISVELKLSKTALMDYLKKDGCIIPTDELNQPMAEIVRNPFLLIR